MTAPRKSEHCPNCRSLGVKHPELVHLWHSHRNGEVTPFDVMAGSGKNIGGNVKLTLNMSGKYLRLQLLTQIESWIIALTAHVERKGTLPSFQNLRHVPNPPPKYPHPNSHYQPLTTKTLMQFGAIATGVAIPVTMDKICPIMIFFLVKF